MKVKINILFVIIQMEMGGAERLVYNIISKLDRTIFNPSIAWFFGDKAVEEFKGLGVPLYHVPKLKRFDFRAMERLGDIINKNNIHVVNAHQFMSFVYCFYGCKIANHRKLIYTEHAGLEIERLSWKWKKIGRHLLKFSDGAIGVSSEVSTQIRDQFKLSSAKIFNIVNGIDLQSFERGVEGFDLKTNLGIKHEEKVIGMVANFRKIKNHLFLLKAFNELIKSGKQVKLILVGQGFKHDSENTEQEIRDYIVENGLDKTVLSLGYRTDIPRLLSIMDIFCLTSFKEGLPISLIEAMAAGLPVVGTDVAGIREVIIPDKNGFLIKLGDVKSLTEALSLLLNDALVRKKMGRSSESLASSCYSLERCVSEYQNLFSSVCEKKR